MEDYMRTLKILNQKKYMMQIAIGIVLTVLILWSICSVRANAAEKAENDTAEFQLQEIQLKSEIRKCLEDMGYFNSGITMTKVMDDDSGREYSVLVHHSYLDAKNTEKVNAVYEILRTIDVGSDNMTVNYTIF